MLRAGKGAIWGLNWVRVITVNSPQLSVNGLAGKDLKQTRTWNWVRSNFFFTTEITEGHGKR